MENNALITNLDTLINYGHINKNIFVQKHKRNIAFAIFNDDVSFEKFKIFGNINFSNYDFGPHVNHNYNNCELIEKKFNYLQNNHNNNFSEIKFDYCNCPNLILKFIETSNAQKYLNQKDNNGRTTLFKKYMQFEDKKDENTKIVIDILEKNNAKFNLDNDNNSPKEAYQKQIMDDQDYYDNSSSLTSGSNESRISSINMCKFG